ncbi:MAG TPA: hypothetical protein VN620_04195, partial [Candidatus Methylomirabilis sp.]|nr:hypothetical protein [Candidatus Methylomirabilis sp.]
MKKAEEKPAVEMTVGGKPKSGASHPPWKSLRDSHIATAPTAARLVQYKIKKGAFLRHPLGLPSGSSFD